MRRRRWRTAVLWGGSTMCVLLAAAFMMSAWWSPTLQFPTQDGPSVTVFRGALMVVVGHELWVLFLQLDRVMDPTGHVPLPPTWCLWNDWGAGTRFIVVPTYAVLLAVAVPTLFVWRFVPKFPRGHCRRCGYNLTGLREARCPECGQAFEETR